MSKHRLDVERTLDIPLREVSGICGFTTTDGRAALAAMGDASSTLAWAPVVGDGLGEWQQVDLADAAGDSLPRTGTQAEAVAADGAGLFLLMLEQPSRVLVFDIHQRALVVRIELVVPPGNPVAPTWATDPNSRGEGLVLLANGHLLVVKEKNPPAILEFGPTGAPPRGLGPDNVIGPDGRWSAPAGPVALYEALATWLLDDELADELGDVSDAAVGADGRLYLLSDQSSCIVRTDPIGSLGGEPVTADAIFTIDGKPDKAEGLALLPDGRALVALDTRKPKDNLVILGPALFDL